MATIFISYRVSDAADQAALLFHMLARRWSADTVFFDQRNLDAGDTFPPMLERAVSGCRLLLLLVGPGWLDEINRRAATPAVDHVRAELQLALARRRQQACEILPVLVKGGRMPDVSQLAPALRPDLGALCSISGWAWGDTDSVRDLLLDRIAERLPFLDALQPRTGPAAAVNAGFQEALRQRSLHFRDPSQLASQLAMALADASVHNRPARVVLVGPAGIGKTQLALQHAQHARRRYACICWLDAADPETLLAGLARCCAEFGLGRPDPANPAAALRRWVDCQPRPWLLVFDGACDAVARLVADASPAVAMHHVVITAAQGRWKAVALPMAAWCSEQGAAYLCARIARATPEEAALLSDELSGMPMALDQAACYIEAEGCSIDDYRRLLADPRSASALLSQAMDTSADTPYAKSIRDTLLIGYAGLSASARQCLCLCARFAPEWLPEQTLRGLQGGQNVLPQPLRAAAGDDAAWIVLRGELQRAGLLSALRESLLDFEGQAPAAAPENMIRLSPLVQRTVRLFVPSTDDDHAVAVALLSHAIAQTASADMHGPRLRALAWHARCVGLEAQDTSSALLARLGGLAFMRLGEPHAALGALRHWRQCCERQAQDAGDPLLARAQLDFAQVALDLKDAEAAEAWARPVMEVSSTARPGTRQADHQLGDQARAVVVKALLQQGRWLEAQATALAVLQDRAAVAQDVDLAVDLLADFGQALRGAGDLARARHIQLQVVSRLVGHGIGAQAVVTAWQQLASTHAALGDFDAALPLQEQVLAARQQAQPAPALQVGSAHAELARTLAGLQRQADAAAHWAQAAGQLRQCLPSGDALRQQVEAEYLTALRGQEELR